MPKIILAKSAGFCFGVNRAVNIVTDLVKQGKRVCTLGPIIHNEQMVEDLNNKGVRIASSPADRNDGEIMIIRSHGVSSSVFDEVASGGEYIDATCPYVSNIHRIVENASREGDVVIIAAPMADFTVKSSWRNITARIRVMTPLSLSMGATFETLPIWIAL